MTDRLRVIVVDDAPEHASMVAEFLRGSWPDAEFHTAVSYDHALQAFEKYTFDAAFLDYWLGARDGLTLLRDLRLRGIDTPVIVLTGRGAEEVAVEAMKAGAADYLSKTNLTPEALERAMRYALALHGEERQRRQVEAALRVSEERFRTLVENSSDVLFMIDVEGRITYMAQSCARHLGRSPEEMVQHSLFDCVHVDDMEATGHHLDEALARPGEAVTAEVRFKHADGSWRVMDIVVTNRLDEPAVKGVVVIARDNTYRRKLEDQLRQAQKLEAVGRLAGGVAHDFNNLLTAILGYCNLILEDLPVETAIRPDLQEIKSAGERAAELTRQLLAFSRRQMLQPEDVGLNDLVRRLEKMLRRLISEDVELITSLAADLPMVRVDPVSIEQVLVNLVLNARDAMQMGGQLTIETSAVDVSSTFTERHIPMTPGHYVLLAVGDSGQGMNEATAARVFEPFFTTKEQGRGSGLGLATVYGIVKQSGGFIWVESEPGRGTTFAIYLPVAEQRTAVQRAHAARTDQKRGWETVLLVEDEDAVRALAREVLRRHGYTVLEARHGLDALRVAERHPDAIQLLVTDVVMPHMSGRDLAERLVGTRPEMKILFMSGYTDHAVVHRDLTPGTSFLRKPFTPDVFARAVRQLLD